MVSSSSNIFCQECGFKTVENAKFCSRCGTKLLKIDAKEKVERKETFDITDKESKYYLEEKSDPDKKWIMILALAMLIIIGGALIIQPVLGEIIFNFAVDVDKDPEFSHKKFMHKKFMHKKFADKKFMHKKFADKKFIDKKLCITDKKSVDKKIVDKKLCITDKKSVYKNQ